MQFVLIKCEEICEVIQCLLCVPSISAIVNEVVTAFVWGIDFHLCDIIIHLYMIFQKLRNISRLKTIKRKGYFIQIQDLQNSC